LAAEVAHGMLRGMFDLTSFRVEEIRHWISSPFFLLMGVFQVWMLIHALREKEWIWALFILVMPLFGSLWYYLQVYRASPGGMRGFELPGARNRKRIKELQAQIHHLDKPHHHLELGDIFFQQGRLAQAEASYRAALERDPQDPDIRAHLGQCLLRQKKAAEALPLLEGVCAQDSKHDYGYSLMALAESRAALGDVDGAIAVWQQVTAAHSYARARVQLAELLLARGQVEVARAQLQEVLDDAPHAPAFARKRERVWVRRARGVLRHLP
jgi:hypothetical protein